MGAFILLKPLENRYPGYSLEEIECKKDKMVIVVLGGGSTFGAPNLPLSADATERFLFGIEIAKKCHYPLIFTGGGLIHPESYSAKAMFEELKTVFNLHNIKIIYENKSLNTKQNAKYVKQLLIREKLPLRIMLITSAYHIPRSTYIFKKLGFEVFSLPTDYKLPERIEITFWSFFPRLQNLYHSAIAIREYIGILSYILLVR